MANLMTDSLDAALTQGRAFRIAVFKRNQLLGGRLRLLLRNQTVLGSANAKVIRIYSVTLYTGPSVAADLDVFYNPTNGLPADPITNYGALTNMDVSVDKVTALTVTADTNPLTQFTAPAVAGYKAARSFPIPPNQAVPGRDAATRIPPGGSVGIVLSAGVAITYALEILFTEDR